MVAAYFKLGKAQVALRNMAEARKAYETSLKTAQAMLQNKGGAEAQDGVKKSYEAFKSMLEAGDAESTVGNTFQAEQAYQECMEFLKILPPDPQKTQANVNLALSASNLGGKFYSAKKYEESRAWYSKAIALEPNNAALLSVSGLGFHPHERFLQSTG